MVFYAPFASELAASFSVASLPLDVIVSIIWLSLDLKPPALRFFLLPNFT